MRSLGTSASLPCFSRTASGSGTAQADAHRRTGDRPGRVGLAAGVGEGRLAEAQKGQDQGGEQGELASIIGTSGWIRTWALLRRYSASAFCTPLLSVLLEVGHHAVVRFLIVLRHGQHVLADPEQVKAVGLLDRGSETELAGSLRESRRTAACRCGSRPRS